MSPFAARQLIGDALDLRHRLPRLWDRVLAGEVKPWIGRKTAEATRSLSAETAAVVDHRVTRWAHSLSWGRLENMIAAAIIAADPAAATEAAEATERSQGVWVGRSSEHGIKDIFIRTEAPNAIWFDASIDRVADSLAALGDIDAKDLRRAKAVGVLAQPQQALNLFDITARLATGGDARSPATSPRPPPSEDAVLTLGHQQRSTSTSAKTRSPATSTGWPGSKGSGRSPSTKPRSGSATATSRSSR